LGLAVGIPSCPPTAGKAREMRRLNRVFCSSMFVQLLLFS
jgi:hypothetical protein